MNDQNTSDVMIESKPDGLWIKNGQLSAGPFQSLNDINPVQVAPQLQVEPKQIFLAKMRSYGAVEGSKESLVRREAAVTVGETFTYTGDRPYFGPVQVAALGFPQSRFMRLTFNCSKAKEDCPACDLMAQLTIDFESADMDPSAFATYFDSGVPRDALRVLTERGIKTGCPAWWNSTVCKGANEKAVTQAVVLDRQGVEGRAWFVHGSRCDLKRTPNWIIAEGWLCRGQRGRIGVLIKAFTMESEVATPDVEDVEKARKVLNDAAAINSEKLKDSTVWKVAQALQRRSQLKGKEIVKGYASDLLTVGSPVWVKTPEGPRQLGATTNELGPTTTAKSLRVRMLQDWLESGKYDTGRKTRAGLTAGAEKSEGIGWIVRKGLLPSMDLSWIVIDNMPPHALDSQIESRRDGVVTITAIRSAELWARCRLKLLSNPLQPFDETLYKCTALKAYDPKLIARFAFALFTYGISAEERYNKDFVKPRQGDAELLEAARTVLKWNLSREVTFTVPKELWSTIMEQGKKLELMYGCEDIPLLLRANPYKLSVLAYAFALLEGYVTPEIRHVQLASKWLEFCAEDIELDKYVKWWKSQHELSDREYEASKKQITSEMKTDATLHGGSIKESYTFKLIEYLAKNEKGQRDEIAAYLSVEAKTVSRKTNLLKGLGLLRSDQGGYHFTAKGVRFFKRWFNEDHVPHVPDVPTSEGQAHSGNEKEKPKEGLTPKSGNQSNRGPSKEKVGLTPESGDMGDIGDMDEEHVTLEDLKEDETVPEPKPMPDFLWRKIPTAEKCEVCGKFAVEYEINDVKGHQILRRCQNCFDKMQSHFSGSIWTHVQPDIMPSLKPDRAVVFANTLNNYEASKPKREPSRRG